MPWLGSRPIGSDLLRRWALLAVVTVAMAPLVAACAPPDLDRQQADVAARTCASLRERVAARTIEEAGLDEALDALDAKADPLAPATFAQDPERWYLDLEAALDNADLGPVEEPTGRSPATLLVAACRRLGP